MNRTLLESTDGNFYEITEREIELAKQLHEMWEDYLDDVDENAMRIAIYRDTIRAEAKAEALREAEEKNKSRYLCIARSIRNNQSKAWNLRITNWVLLVNYFGLGSTRAHAWCEWLGINPESHSAAITKEQADGSLSVTV